MQDLSNSLPYLGTFGDGGESLGVTVDITDEARTLMAIMFGKEPGHTLD